MKNIHLKSVFIVAMLALVVSCKKSEYLTDDGVHNPITPLSNYDYLKQHGWNSFDTLIAIIDHFNLKEDVNKANTFFAPTNYSITRYVDQVKFERNKPVGTPFTIDSLFKHLKADSVKQYLFAEKISLADAPMVITPLTSLGKTTCAVQRIQQTDGAYYQWASTPVYSLYFFRIRGAVDDPAIVLPPNDPTRDTRVICQTTGIRTSGGNTTLHVLANTHVFVRF